MATRRPTAMILAGAVALLGAGTAVRSAGSEGSSPRLPETRATDGSTGAAPAADPAQDTVRRDTLTPAQRAVRAHRRARRGPEQPVPFSHRFHVSELRIGCEYCHTGTRRSQVATMPATSVCMGCHRTVGRDLAALDTLRTAWQNDEPVGWERIYKVPEFVQFKHQPHLRNAIECQECHGPVEEMDRVYKAASLSMGWCLSCHRQQPKDSDVATTYQLVRDVRIPDAPRGRQTVGLYPTTISSGYASARAPDDCATCHY